MINTEQKVKQLVIDECACYSSTLNDIKHYCDKEYDEDCCCRLFKNDRCGYFEKAVLPMNPQLRELYRAELKGEATEKDKEKIIEQESSIIGKVNVRCKRCNDVFLADNYRTQYCDKCKRIMTRKNKREYMERKKAKLENQLFKTVAT